MTDPTFKTLNHSSPVSQAPVTQLDELLERQAMGDDIARLARWFCLRCERFFPGKALFDRIVEGERLNRCPHCNSVRITIPSRIDDVGGGLT
jgi:DNA-directed RNA polymerase subunit RPC12/RpoP